MLNYESDKFALAFRAAHAAEPSLCVASCLVGDRESMPARSLLVAVLTLVLSLALVWLPARKNRWIISWRRRGMCVWEPFGEGSS